MPNRALRIIAVALLLSATIVAAASADDDRPLGLDNVGLDQRLDQQVPLDLAFRDEAGRPTRLSDYFGARPVVLTFNYDQCPMLCPLVLNDVLRAIRGISLTAGRDYRVLTVSIDPSDSSAQSAARHDWFVERYARDGASEGWHFLTGDQQSITSLARAVGFRYTFDPQTRQYAHTAGIVILTSEGRVSRYFYGLEYSPRDLRLALVEASAGRIGSLVDEALLFCFHYDPAAGRYTFAVLNGIRAAGVATVAGLVGLMTVLFRREHKDSSHQAGGKRRADGV